MRSVWLGSALVIGLLAGLVARSTSQDVFSEELLTTWLTPTHLLVHLRFDQGTTASRLHTSFPHTVQHLATTLPVHSVELSLTSGRWDYAEWGWPLLPVKPIGAALDASFHSGLDPRTLTALWSALVHALSGLSCASLSLLKEPGSVSGGRIALKDLPGWAQARAGGTDGGARNAHASDGARGPNGTCGAGGDAVGQRLHALLPREALCTENLTPWLRLLPCRDQAGLASLLRHRPTVFGAEYVSLGLLVGRGATREGRSGVRLTQTFTFVVRTVVLPAPTPPSSPMTPAPQGPDLETLLSARVRHFCPAALRSQVNIAVHGASASAIGLETVTNAAEASSARYVMPAAEHASHLVPLTATLTREGPAPVPVLSAAVPQLLMYDTLELMEDPRGQGGLHLQLPAPPAARSAAGPRRPAAAASDATGAWPPGPVDLAVTRYTTGAGLLRGGMVLAVRRSEALRARLAADRACGGARVMAAAVAAEEGGGGSRAAGVRGAACLSHVLCVHQVFPWYVRPWVHTLTLSYDGQVMPYQSYLVAHHVQPAVQRTSPGVLDLCLHVPPQVAEVRLRMAFSKAFLTAMEYPPDAHRGFDVPAAVVSYVDPLHAHAAGVQWRVVRSGTGGQQQGDGGGSAGVEETVSSPLLLDLAPGPVQQVYTPGLLVPLAAPDFSMPYNVICLSSTVLAVYFGAVLNLLTRRGRGGTLGGDAVGDDTKRRKGTRAAKILQVVVLAAAFVALALYLDADLREQAEGLLSSAGLHVRKPG